LTRKHPKIHAEITANTQISKKMKKKLRMILQIQKNVLPLHSLCENDELQWQQIKATGA
jgi:hypothetical protein